MSVLITDDMREAARIESAKRDPHINHHFDLDYMNGNQRDVIGFLGEFACKEYLGLNWRSGIRENYDNIDSGDILQVGAVVDIKTETIPKNKLLRLIKGELSDDVPYGRRLINENQISLLNHYDYVAWGAFFRESNEIWFPLGYIESKYILENYQPTIHTPFHRRYREPCINVRQSELRDLSELRKILENVE